ncbi:MAG: dynamin family protein [Planctomycetaceae bacterium]|jgi:GTP-binding protein EngB required for normal cell division|nr:dynamin family protein [Planctomycetaceae bacterium]
MPKQLQHILDEFLMLVNESEAYSIAPPVKSIMQEIRLMLAEIKRRLRAVSKQYIVAVVGLTNVGKSTLLNALFGQELAPRRNGPCTAAPIEFEYGEGFAVDVHYFQKLSRTHWDCSSVEAVHERLQALAADSGAEQSRSIQRVIVHAPLPLLQHGLVIADTPGFGAAQVDGAEGSHEESLKIYLTENVSQVFWVVLGEQGIGKREVDFQDKMFGTICDDVIVTGCDDWEQRDKDRFRKRFVSLFSRMPRFHFTSGKLGNEARKTDDTELLEQAGIPAVEERIKSLSVESGRLESIQESILAIANDLKFWFDENKDKLEQQHNRLQSLWRPDSWIRWQMVDTADEFKKRLMERLPQ